MEFIECNKTYCPGVYGRYTRLMDVVLHVVDLSTMSCGENKSGIPNTIMNINYGFKANLH